MLTEDKVDLSIIITIVGGAPFLRKCLENLTAHIVDRSIEVIVPYHRDVDGLEDLITDYPQVIFVEISSDSIGANSKDHTTRHEIFDKGKSLGISISRGELIALLDDQGVPAPNWCKEIFTTSSHDYGAIGGAIEQRGSGILNWAVYFNDFGRYQLPFPIGSTHYLSDINICYQRSALEAVRDTWRLKFNEVAVNTGLLREGYLLWRNPALVVFLDRGKLNITELIRERVSWGRIFGAVRARNIPSIYRYIYIIITPLIPFVIIIRLFWIVFTRKSNRIKFLASLPISIVLAVAWAIGEFVGYVTGR